MTSSSQVTDLYVSLRMVLRLVYTIHDTHLCMYLRPPSRLDQRLCLIQTASVQSAPVGAKRFALAGPWRCCYYVERFDIVLSEPRFRIFSVLGEPWHVT